MNLIRLICILALLILPDIIYSQQISKNSLFKNSLEILFVSQTPILKINNRNLFNLYYGEKYFYSNTFNAKMGFYKRYYKDNILIFNVQYSKLVLTETEGFSYSYCDPKLYGATKVINSQLKFVIKKIDFDILFSKILKTKRLNITPKVGIVLSKGILKFSDVTNTFDNKIEIVRVQDHVVYPFSNSINFGPVVNIGISYGLNKKFDLRLANEFKYWVLKEQVLSYYSNTNYFQLSIGLGVGYWF